MEAADWLGLAAAPTFAAMALATIVLGPGPAAMICAAGPTGWPLDGMGLMYLLMSAFHTAPWLRLASGRHATGRDDPGPAAGGVHYGVADSPESVAALIQQHPAGPQGLE